MTDELVKRLRGKKERVHDLSGVYYIVDADCQEAADRIEQLEKELSTCRMAQVVMDNTVALMLARAEVAEDNNVRLREVLRPCIKMLDSLIVESGKSIDYGQEDIFRMGEWFEDEELAAIEIARTALEETL